MAKKLIILTCFFVIFDSHKSFSKSFQHENKNLDFNFNFNPNSSNQLCNSHLVAYQNDLEQNVLWARMIRDSWGKVPSGMFSGNYFDIGNFDQCIDVRHISKDVGEIAGQHCTLMIPYDLEPKAETKLAAPSRSWVTKLLLYTADTKYSFFPAIFEYHNRPDFFTDFFYTYIKILNVIHIINICNK